MRSYKVEDIYKNGKARPCTMTGLAADNYIEISDDKHNWCRKIPVSQAYWDLRVVGKLSKYKDLERKAYKIFFLAELNQDGGGYFNFLKPLEDIWKEVRPEIEYHLAKMQQEQQEIDEETLAKAGEGLLNELDNIEIE